MDHSRFRELVKQLYAVVGELETMFDGRPFTPDGHLVGSLGEALVADRYDVTLMPPSNKGYDALDSRGRKVEIKATQRSRVAFRSCPESVIVIKIDRTGSFEEVYNGPGGLVWKNFEGKKPPSNGQFQIGLNKLRSLQALVDEADRVPYISFPA